MNWPQSWVSTYYPSWSRRASSCFLSLAAQSRQLPGGKKAPAFPWSMWVCCSRAHDVCVMCIVINVVVVTTVGWVNGPNPSPHPHPHPHPPHTHTHPNLQTYLDQQGALYRRCAAKNSVFRSFFHTHWIRMCCGVSTFEKYKLTLPRETWQIYQLGGTFVYKGTKQVLSHKDKAPGACAGVERGRGWTVRLVGALHSGGFLAQPCRQSARTPAHTSSCPTTK
jgi:hypothetical protein